MLGKEGYVAWSWAYRISAYAGVGYFIASSIGWFAGTTVAAKIAGTVLGAIGVHSSAAVITGYAAVLAGYVAAFCVVLIIVIALILLFKPDEFEKWLDRCTWGNKDLPNRFNNFNKEQQAYLKLVGA